MSANERHVERRALAWSDVKAKLSALVPLDRTLPRFRMQEALDAVVEVARAHAQCVVCDGEHDRYNPFPPEDA